MSTVYGFSFWLAILIPAVLWASVGTEEEANRPPNMVYILADDLGYGELSCYGQKRFSTPNIDRLAAQGMLFTEHYAGAPVCAPSRNTLMTGEHTGHVTIRHNFFLAEGVRERVGLKPGDVTIAERLQAVGYATGMVGKWGLGEADTEAAPWHEGWEFFYGFVNQSHAHNQYPEFLYRNEVMEPLEANFSHKEGTFANDLLTAEALGFIERSAQEKRPFFLYVAYTTPHADLKCPQDSVEAVREAYAWARDPLVNPQSVVFAAMVQRMDRDVGAIVDRLEELGMGEETVVMFSSDNGPHDKDGKDNAFFEASGEFRGIKFDLYEGGIRVPMIVRWPGRVAAGSRASHVSAFWDVAPTMLELAGIDPAGLSFDGISFLPTLLDEKGRQHTHDYLYWEFVHKGEPRQAVRMGNWKAVRYGLEAKTELFNLTEDPGENRNLAGQKAELVSQAEHLFRHARTESPYFPLSSASSQ